MAFQLNGKFVVNNIEEFDKFLNNWRTTYEDGYVEIPNKFPAVVVWWTTNFPDRKDKINAEIVNLTDFES